MKYGHSHVDIYEQKKYAIERRRLVVNKLALSSGCSWLQFWVHNNTTIRHYKTYNMCR
jgi:hypothetical protein